MQLCPDLALLADCAFLTAYFEHVRIEDHVFCCLQIVDSDPDHLMIEVHQSKEHRAAVQNYAQQYAREISLMLVRIPRELLLLLKTNDCLRAVDMALVRAQHLLCLVACVCGIHAGTCFYACLCRLCMHVWSLLTQVLLIACRGYL